MKKTNDTNWYDRIIKLISFRPRSVFEIKQYLQKHKVEAQDIKKVIEKLMYEKLLDDRDFAIWWIEQRLTFRPKAPRIIAYELQQKGISKDTIEEVLHISSEQELLVTIKLAQKKWLRLSHYPLVARKQKVIEYLLRRGFSYPTSKKALLEVIDAGRQKE